MALARIGLDLEASDEEAEQFCLEILRRSLDYSAVARWAGDRVVELDTSAPI